MNHRSTKAKIPAMIISTSIIIVVSIISLLTASASASDTSESDQFHVICKDHEETVNAWNGYLFLPSQATDYYPHSDSVNIVQSSSIATIFINLTSDTFEVMNNTKEYEVEAASTILSPTGDILFDGSLKYIKTRGNGTFNTEKKPYEIKFNNKISLLDMDAAKEWILLANAYDESIIKNKLVQDYAKTHTSLPEAECVPIDLYINGEYRGNYYLSEKVQVKKERINIQNLDDIMEQYYSKDSLQSMPRYASDDQGYVIGITDPADITGGYLIEMVHDNLLDSTIGYFRTGNDTLFRIKSPKYASQAEVEYISELLKELELAVAADDGINPQTGRHFTDIIDVTSFLEKYALEMLFQNPDQGYGSMFFYKDSDKIDGLLYAGSPWDYDLILNSHKNCETFPFLYTMYLREDLLSHPEVMEEFIEIFEETCKPYVENELTSLLNQYTDTLTDSFNMNHIRWADLGKTNDFTTGYSTLEANLEYIRIQLNASVKSMENWIYHRDEYCTLSFADKEITYLIHKGSAPEISSPNYANYAGLFNGWRDSNGELYDPHCPLTEDSVYTASWIPIDTILADSESDIRSIGLADTTLEPLKKVLHYISSTKE